MEILHNVLMAGLYFFFGLMVVGAILVAVANLTDKPE